VKKPGIILAKLMVEGWPPSQHHSSSGIWRTELERKIDFKIPWSRPCMLLLNWDLN